MRFFSKALCSLLIIFLLPSLAEARSEPKINCCENLKTVCWNVSPTKKKPVWFMDVGLGWVFSQKLGTSYLANVDFPSDQYSSPKVNQVMMSALALGYVWSRQNEWLPFTSLGFEYSYDMPAKINGTIDEFSDPDQTNFNYQYKVAHQNLLLTSKADLYRWQHFMPYVSIGMGIVWNRSSDYNEQAISKLPSPRTNPEFSNKTVSNFSYSLGTGLDYIFNKNFWGGIGYRYDHFGWGETGDTHAEFTDKSLKQTSRAHTIILSLRYLFG